jgi:hypothetical protein
VKNCQMSKYLSSVVFTGCIPTVCRTVPPCCRKFHHAVSYLINLANGNFNPISMLNEQRSQYNGQMLFDSVTRHGRMSTSLL